MALIKCPECNHKVSDTAKYCPNCGYKLSRSKVNIKKIVAAIGIVVCCIIAVICFLQPKVSKSENYIDPIGEKQKITNEDTLKYMSEEGISNIDEMVRKSIEWYNTIDSSQKEYREKYQYSKDDDQILFPEDLYIPDEMQELSEKITKFLPSSEDMLSSKMSEQNKKIPEIVLKADSAVMYMAQLFVGNKTQISLTLGNTNNTYYFISKEEWLNVRQGIMDAKEYFYSK